MKISYKFVDGTTTEVEVSEEIGAVIVESRHAEFNNNRTETRRHESYDAEAYSVLEKRGTEDPGIQALFPTDAQDRVALALSALTLAQREVIQALFLEDKPAKEYAKEKGISEAAVSKAKKAALKKMKEILSDG